METSVSVGMAVSVGTGVADETAVEVAVSVGVTVDVNVGLAVFVGVAVLVGVAVGAGPVRHRLVLAEDPLLPSARTTRVALGPSGTVIATEPLPLELTTFVARTFLDP